MERTVMKTRTGMVAEMKIGKTTGTADPALPKEPM